MKTKVFQQKLDEIVNKWFLWAIPKVVLPNYLTYLRLLLVPLLYYLLNVGHYYYASLVFFFAAFTDLLDGAMARTRDQITDLGKILDPIADKALVVVVLLFLGFNYLIVKVFILVIIIEVVANLFAAMFAKYLGRPVGANFFGKIKMVFQCLSVGLFFMAIILENDSYILYSEYLLYIALFFACLSGLEIVLDGIKKHFKANLGFLD